MSREQFGRLRAWSVAGLLIYGLIVAAILLLPVSYSQIVNAIGDWVRYDLGISFFGSGWIEFGANILMFAPLGFLLTLLFRHRWYGVALALALSAGAELVQFLIPMREPSLRDVLGNVIGASIGALLAWLLVVKREHAAVPRPESATTASSE